MITVDKAIQKERLEIWKQLQPEVEDPMRCKGAALHSVKKKMTFCMFKISPVCKYKLN